MRTLENKPGVTYDSLKTTVLFAEDWNELSELIGQNHFENDIFIDDDVVGRNLQIRYASDFSFFPFAGEAHIRTDTDEVLQFYGVNGEVIYAGNQAFFGFAERSDSENRNSDGGLYRVNHVLNFWNNIVGQNTVSISDHGKAYIGNNSYGTFYDSEESDNFPAHLTVDGDFRNNGADNWIFGGISSDSLLTMKTDEYVNVTINETNYKLALVN